MSWLHMSIISGAVNLLIPSQCPGPLTSYYEVHWGPTTDLHWKVFTTKAYVHPSYSKWWIATWTCCSLSSTAEVNGISTSTLLLSQGFLCSRAGWSVLLVIPSSVPLPSPSRANMSKVSFDSTQVLLFVIRVWLFTLWSLSGVEYKPQLVLLLLRVILGEREGCLGRRWSSSLFLGLVSFSSHGAQYSGDHCLLSPSKRIMGQTLMP